MTKLEGGASSAALTIDGKDYTLTISPEGLKLTEKGKRLGQQLAWKDLISGEAARDGAQRVALCNAPTAASALHRPRRLAATAEAAEKKGNGKKAWASVAAPHLHRLEGVTQPM